ncbi:protein lethal(2)essential for life-like [Lycorma delicatula]|uniref:protein lethal(2)essential for life-like n=1 Tax=Lycorma delicatula TaxID=130591 RepID=UPI003F515CF6
MSLPLILSDVLNELYGTTTSSHSDQHYKFSNGHMLDNEVRQQKFSVSLHSGYLRPWRYLSSADSGVSSFQLSRNIFKIILDVKQFKPDEISVKVMGNFILVEAKHEEREDEHGLVARQFSRRYKVPDDTSLEKLKSTLSSNGILTISAPRKVSQLKEGRSIPIVQTNEPS